MRGRVYWAPGLLDKNEMNAEVRTINTAVNDAVESKSGMRAAYAAFLKSWIGDIALGGMSAMLLIASFPSHDCGSLAWVALVPLLIALEGMGPARALSIASVTGAIFFTGIFYWIWVVESFSPIDYGLLVTCLSLPVALFGVALNWVRKKTGLPNVLVAPPLWVALEYARSHAAFLSAPWMLLGHSQYLHPSLIQITAITGVYGLSFLIVLVNAAIADSIMYHRVSASHGHVGIFASAISMRATLLAAAILITANWAYGRYVIAEGVQGRWMRVALVQGNVPQDRKWDRSYLQRTLVKYAELTREAARGTPSLIIWPETAIPGDVQHDPELQRRVSQLAQTTKSYLLVGSAENAKFSHKKRTGRFYNSLFLFTPEGRIAGAYHKIGLVPFGEYTPLKNYIKWPEAIVAPGDDMEPGDQLTLFVVDHAVLAGTICWENIFPDLFRKFVKHGAGLMINATNEAWFGETAAPYQLLAMSVFRAVENHVSIARAANTGVSALIDPFGRITGRLHDARGKELFVSGSLSGDVLVSSVRSFYTVHGDVFAFTQIAMCVALVFFVLINDKPAKQMGIIS